MSQIHFIACYLIIFTSLVMASIDGNFTNCPSNYRMSRGINFFGNERNFVQSKREPRLFSYNTEDDDVNIRMEFGIPFITIPTKRTVDGLQNLVYDVMEGQLPKPQLNFHALGFIGILCIGFSSIGVLMENFNLNKYVLGKAPFYFYNRERKDNSNETIETINIWQIIENLDKTLAKFNVDTSACVQHRICQKVQESLFKVEQNTVETTNIDIILEGMTRSDWIMRYISGTAIEDAILTARNGKNCDKVFSSCTVNLQFLYSGLSDMIKNVV